MLSKIQHILRILSNSYFLVEMVGGINKLSPMIGNNANQLLAGLAQLIASNPEYIANGIPSHLIQQMYKTPQNSQQDSKVIINSSMIRPSQIHVCFL